MASTEPSVPVSAGDVAFSLSVATGTSDEAGIACHALRVSSEALIGVSADWTVVSWSLGAEDLFGMDAEEMVGTSALDLLAADVDRGTVRAGAALGRIERWQMTIRTRVGSSLVVDAALHPVPGHPGAFSGAVLRLHATAPHARLRELERRHRGRLVIDALTGLPNRRAFDAAMTDMLQQPEPVSALVIDVDRFAVYNDDFGQAAGDEVLERIADVVLELAPADAAVARLGDDEFGVALTGTLDLVAGLARAFQRELRRRRLPVTVSWGVACTSVGGLDRDGLLTAADADLYVRQEHAKSELYAAYAADRLAGDGHAPPVSAGGALDVALHAELRETLSSLRQHAGVAVAFFAELDDAELVVRVASTDDDIVAEGLRLTDYDNVLGRLMRGDTQPIFGSLSAPPWLPTGSANTTAGPGRYVAVPVQIDHDRGGAVGFLALDDGTLDASLCATAATLVTAQLRRRTAAEHGDRTRGETLAARALLAALAARDAYTGSHSETVVQLARAVGQDLGLTGTALIDLERVAVLHDIGKLGIPDSILHKPGPLDPHEWQVMQTHPTVGAEIAASIPSLAGLAAAIEAEHERWDGAGYPNGLAGDAIPLAARIILACDAFDAMTTDRPYRAAMGVADAREELRYHRGSQFDPAVVDALERVLNRRSHAAHLNGTAESAPS